jgi:hypothetical protein
MKHGFSFIFVQVDSAGEDRKTNTVSLEDVDVELM